jgi:hypothetical protein
MRRNRRGPGGSGSASFLARALRANEGELRAAFAAIGLTIPATPADKPVYSEIGNEVWWLNLDSRGGLWINGREKKEGESLAPGGDAMDEAPLESAPGPGAPDAVPAPEVVPALASASDFESAGSNITPPIEAAPVTMPGESIAASAPTVSPAPSTVGAENAEAPLSDVTGLGERVPPNADLAAVRLLLKETKAGSAAEKVDRLAGELGRAPEEFIATLVNAGLRVPERPREKPLFVEHAGEVLWLNKNAKGELWLNVKFPKSAQKETDSEEVDEGGEGSEVVEGEGEKKSARRNPRVRTKKPSEEASADIPPAQSGP